MHFVIKTSNQQGSHKYVQMFKICQKMYAYGSTEDNYDNQTRITFLHSLAGTCENITCSLVNHI